MYRLILIGLLAVGLNAKSQVTKTITWGTHNFVVKMYGNNTMLVGDLLYDVDQNNGQIVLYVGNKVMLYCTVSRDGYITLINADNPVEKRRLKQNII